MSDHRSTLLSLTTVLALVGGCASKPSQANVVLRKEKQGLNDRIALLLRQHDADAASVAAFQQSHGSLQTLPQARLDQLFTTHGIKLNRLTGGVDIDSAQPGDDALKVYFVPTDEQDQPLKAVGDVTIEVFAEGSRQPFQSWTFTAEQVKSAWLGQALQYQFVLTCPFQNHPGGSKLDVRLTFVDALTGRSFAADKTVPFHPG